MSVRNLDALLKPRSLALIGASRRPGSVGAVVARNLVGGGFKGTVMPVHPNRREVEGLPAYPSVAALPEAPDLAVIATPPDTVPELIAELGARGSRAAVVITAGFGEGGDAEGLARRDAMLNAACPHLLRIVGPNCLGIMAPGAGLNASFSHIAPREGDLAFVTQSGAMVTAMLDWATPRGIGFSQVISLGAMSDVDFGDLLDYLAVDPETRAVLLYVEALSDARKFMSAGRAAARAKPVIVIKGGRHAEGARAAASHTGALAGLDAVYDAAFSRAGLLRVYALDELFDAAETLSTATATRGDRLAILTNGGGFGVLASDALVDEGGRLAELSAATVEQLNGVLPPTWSHGNPVDIIGDAPGSRYADALKILLAAPEIDGILVMNCPTAVADSSDAARAVVETLEGGPRRPVFTAWVGEAAVREARALFTDHRIPTFDTPGQAVRAFMHLERYRRNQELLMEIPPSLPEPAVPEGERVRSILDAALAAQQDWLGEAEAKEVLAAYGIPVVETRIVADVAAAKAAAIEIAAPVALKIRSPDITHKSDYGGVALDLESAAAVERAAEAMLTRIGQALPDARLSGFTVQAMCRRPGSYELIAGVVEDARFGPVMLFGEGGTAVEEVQDKALALPPLNVMLARRLMAQTRIHRLLKGYRDRPPAALDEIAKVLVNLSQLVIDFAEIKEVDVNPLLADADGVIALDARIRVLPVEGRARVEPAARLAIRPYPKHLETTIVLPDGEDVFLRPIRPEDAPLLQEGFKKLDPEDVRMRFFAYMSNLSTRLAARLTQIDYAREMAFVAFDSKSEAADGWGVVRLIADPDNAKAEFAVIVRSDLKGRGLGRALMERILDYARSRGIGEVWGDVLHENRGMLNLARDLGFALHDLDEDRGVVRVTKRIDAPGETPRDGPGNSPPSAPCG